MSLLTPEQKQMGPGGLASTEQSCCRWWGGRCVDPGGRGPRGHESHALLEPSHAVMGLTGHRVTPTRKDGHPEVEAASWLPRVSGPVSRVVFSSIQSIELM